MSSDLALMLSVGAGISTLLCLSRRTTMTE